MHRKRIDQLLSSEGTVYLHAFRNAQSSTNAGIRVTSARTTDLGPSIDPLTPNAMIPSLSGA